MADLRYTFAVARIRTLERELLTREFLEQLIAAPTVKTCFSMLKARGWEREEEKLGQLIRELDIDGEVQAIFLYPLLFHNLKAAVRESYLRQEGTDERLYHPATGLSPKELTSAVRNREFSRLPSFLEKAARESYLLLLHTGDGRRSDMLIDRMALQMLYETGKKSKSRMIREYAEVFTASADVLTAVRAQQLGETEEVLEESLVECESISRQLLIRAVYGGIRSLREYLEGTAYAKGAAFLENLPEFERWCGNLLAEKVKAYRYEDFSPGPLAAYVLEKQREIRNIRMILTGKRNGIPDTVIRESVGFV